MTNYEMTRLGLRVLSASTFWVLQDYLRRGEWWEAVELLRKYAPEEMAKVEVEA